MAAIPKSAAPRPGKIHEPGPQGAPKPAALHGEPDAFAAPYLSVSPGRSTTSSAATLCFASSSRSASGVPVSAGKVP